MFYHISVESYVTSIPQARDSIHFFPVTGLFLASIREIFAYASGPSKFEFGGASFVPRFSKNK
jgi:hypothetical protein